MLQRGPASSRGERSVGAVAAGDLSDASTRPRIITRGETRRVIFQVNDLACFNEAPHHHAGRGCSRRRSERKPNLLQRGPASSRGERLWRQSVLQRIPCSFNEAPHHHAGRGCRGQRRDDRILASTRPRIITRGELAARGAVAWVDPASTRPRIITRGEDAMVKDAVAKALAGFNEAPHHHAGRVSCSPEDRDSFDGGFNEAPHHHAGRGAVARPLRWKSSALQRGPASSRGERRSTSTTQTR